MAQLQPKGPFDRTAADTEAGDAFSALTGRFGLTVPHEWWPSAHLLKSFEAAGFSHVQMDAPPVSVLSDTRLLMAHSAALDQALSTTQLSCVLHAPSGLRLGTEAGDRAMDGLIDYATEIGGQHIVYHALALPDAPESEDALRFEIASLRRASARAGRNGLVINLENLAPLYPGAETLSANPMSLRGAAQRLSSDGIGVCLDLGHAHITAELRRTSLAHLIEPVMDVVTLIHAHDNFGARRSCESAAALGVDPLRLDLHLPPGRGTLTWQDVAPIVLRSEAPVILEVHPPYRPRVAELHDTAAILLTNF